MALKQTGDRGARKVEIPDLTGMTREQAQAALTYKGLAYSETNENKQMELKLKRVHKQLEQY